MKLLSLHFIFVYAHTWRKKTRYNSRQKKELRSESRNFFLRYIKEFQLDVLHLVWWICTAFGITWSEFKKQRQELLCQISYTNSHIWQNKKRLRFQISLNRLEFFLCSFWFGIVMLLVWGQFVELQFSLGREITSELIDVIFSLLGKNVEHF